MRGIDYGIDPADFPSAAELAEMEEEWRRRDAYFAANYALVQAALVPTRGGSPEMESEGTLSTNKESA